MNSLAEVLKIFLEKHFIPTVIAIVIAFASYLILPENTYLVMKLNFGGFLIFAFAVSFLLLQLIINTIQFFNSNKAKRETIKYQNEQIERKNKEALEQLWSYVDSLSSNDFILLQKYLESANKPITKNANTFYSAGSLLASNYVHSRIVQEPREKTIECERIITNGYQIPMKTFTEGKKEYILAESFYQLLKYSKEKYGRISHFK
jgi:hypothetical protein